MFDVLHETERDPINLGSFSRVCPDLLELSSAQAEQSKSR